MTGIRYLTDPEGQPQAVVLPIELWRRLLPREDATVEELTEAVEDSPEFQDWTAFELPGSGEEMGF